MSVAAVTDSTQSAASAAASSTQELSDRFLKLLVTQLKNQDPLNPLDNAEVTTQLAQMSTVEGINKLNDGLSGFIAASQALQAGSLVGHSVLAQGDAIQLTSSGAIGGAELASAADSVKVQVVNASGTIVRTIDLGQQGAGMLRFSWDGLDDKGNAVDTGTYSFQVKASAGGNSVDATTYSLGTVSSVTLNSGGLEAEVTNLGYLTLDQIKQVF